MNQIIYLDLIENFRGVYRKENLAKIKLSQKKNLEAIILLLQRENKRREMRGEPIKAEVEFYLSDYAEVRGYSKKELSEAILNKLKKDIYSGALTTYYLKEAEYNGKKYKVHGLAFYRLITLDVVKDKWLIIIDEFFRDEILHSGTEFIYKLESKNLDMGGIKWIK